jgi:hypothetical protein
MKKLRVIVLIMLPFMQMACSKKNVRSLECEVLKSAVKDIMAEDDLKEMILADRYRIWNIGIDIDYNIQGEEGLPKTEEERKERLKGNLIDAYRIWYVFAFPITDTLFSKKDRKFISKQMRDTTANTLPCTFEHTRLVKPKEGEMYGYYFCKPVFDKDYKYSIIRKYTNYDITADGTIFGEAQTLYYKYDKEKGWVRIFAGGKWQ